MLKLYCYTDETRQDTKGKFFLVSIVLSSKEDLVKLKERVAEIEKETKGKTKWTKTNNKRKVLFIKEILSMGLLKRHLYYKVGLKDQQDVLLRLADSLAGFVRDCLEDRKYTKNLITRDKFKSYFIKL